MRLKTTKRWNQALLGLIALTLAPMLYAANPCATGGAPVMRDGSGAGGTGLRPEGADGSGQGGTGVTPDRKSDGDGSGAGGTGHTVGVEGVITGFASICVNGLELHYQPTTSVTIHGKTASLSDLKVGQVVRALAKGQGDQLALQRVHVRHLLVAQVQGLDSGGLRAQGRNISLSPGAVLPAGLVPGVKVAVSGFTGAQGHSVATRLDVVPDDTPDSLTGEVQRNAQGKLTVDGVTLEGRLPKLEPGDTVRAEGRYAQGRMQVTRFEREERVMPVDRVVIQGLVRHADKAGLNIGGQRFLIDGQTRNRQAPPRAGEWAIVNAIREGGQLHAREVEAAVRPGNSRNSPIQREDDSARRGGFGEKTLDQNDEHHADTEFRRSDQKAERPEKPESGERQEHSEKPEIPEKIERIEESDRLEKIEKPEKVEKPEKIERPEKTEKVEKPEKVERPEKIEKPERVERVERVERHEHDD